MDRFVITSLHEGAGKTSVIIGISKVLNLKIGYIKPFGERFLYRKKRLWDYDAALITNIFGLGESPEDMSIGFHHSKLLSMLDRDTTRDKLQELLASVGEDKETVFVECGKDITYGTSVHLDALTIARDIDAQLIVVSSGSEDAILDDVYFLEKYIRMDNIRCKGIIFNKIDNVADFCESHLPLIQKCGIEVLGVIPFVKELSYFTVSYLVDRLFAKVIASEDSLNRTVRQVFIGSMSVDTALNNSLFHQESNVVITSGDRSDMIDAALETNAAAIVLTNNILPPPNLISKASKQRIPLLLVPADICDIAMIIDSMACFPTKDELGKVALIEEMIRCHVHLEKLSHP